MRKPVGRKHTLEGTVPRAFSSSDLHLSHSERNKYVLSVSSTPASGAASGEANEIEVVPAVLPLRGYRQIVFLLDTCCEELS